MTVRFPIYNNGILIIFHRKIRFWPGRNGRPVAAFLAALLCLPGMQTVATDALPPGSPVLQSRALEVCAVQRGANAAMPPIPFTTDGCSMWPDAGYGQCCVAHDMQYWCGGSAAQRWEADRQLQQCLSDLGRPAMGLTMRIGTRLGGWSVLPLPWRWGYGWPYPGSGS